MDMWIAPIFPAANRICRVAGGSVQVNTVQGARRFIPRGFVDRVWRKPFSSYPGVPRQKNGGKPNNFSPYLSPPRLKKGRLRVSSPQKDLFIHRKPQVIHSNRGKKGRIAAMINFTSVRKKEISLRQLIQDLGKVDLHHLTNEMVEEMLSIFEGCEDPDVVFVPEDPEAYDAAAATEEEIDMPWTLGHVVVHTTASAEEAAALAAELARGVAFHGRSRYEIPWQAITTIGQCRARLEESRRMRLASLDMWPGTPHLENVYRPSPKGTQMNAIARFVYGLMHDDSHLGQLRDIVQQAREARS